MSSNFQKVVIPWRDILTSLPVFAIVVTNVTCLWQGYTLLTNIPTYMREVLRFDIRSVSVDLLLYHYGAKYPLNKIPFPMAILNGHLESFYDHIL